MNISQVLDTICKLSWGRAQTLAKLYHLHSNLGRHAEVDPGPTVLCDALNSDISLGMKRWDLELSPENETSLTQCPSNSLSQERCEPCALIDEETALCCRLKSEPHGDVTR